MAAVLAVVADLPRPALMPVPRPVGDGIEWGLIDYLSGVPITDLADAGLPQSWGMGLG